MLVTLTYCGLLLASIAGAAAHKSVVPPSSIAAVRLISSGLPPISSTGSLALSGVSGAVIPGTGSSGSTVTAPCTAIFRLSSSFHPIPAKLSAKITSLQYIDLRELLQDNLGLLKNLEELDTKLVSASLPTAARPRLREVKDILTWVSCFTLYVAVLGQAHPHLMQQRLAYMALVVREARRNGGDGWRSYDAIFRQNAAVSPDVDWSQLDSALYTSTFLAQRTQAGLFCHHCFGADHVTRDCALQPFAATADPSPLRSPPKKYFKQPSSFKARAFGQEGIPICLSWNKGACIKGSACRYRHSCAVCPGNHPACQCPEAPPSSRFKRNAGNSSSSSS